MAWNTVDEDRQSFHAVNAQRLATCLVASSFRSASTAHLNAQTSCISCRNPDCNALSRMRLLHCPGSTPFYFWLWNCLKFLALRRPSCVFLWTLSSSTKFSTTASPEFHSSLPPYQPIHISRFFVVHHPPEAPVTTSIISPTLVGECMSIYNVSEYDKIHAVNLSHSLGDDGAIVHVSCTLLMTRLIIMLPAYIGDGTDGGVILRGRWRY